MEVVDEPAQEMEILAEVVVLKVAKVLAEVPKSMRISWLKPTPTKEIGKDKKGKSINLEAEEEDIKDIPMDDEDVGVEVEVEP